MSLNAIINNASSGLRVSQAGLSTVSDNVANVNTAGYVRKVVDQQSVVANGAGSGVSVSQITTVADQFLEQASRQAGSDASKASVVSDYLDQAQSAFGDPTSSSDLFSSLDDVFSSFITLSSSGVTSAATAKAQATPEVSNFFSQATDIGSQLDGLSAQADTKIGDDVDTINQLLGQIDTLNAQISKGQVAGGDVSGSQDQQSQLLDQLSSLMQVQVTQRSNGGVVVRASDGAALVGAGAVSTVGYDASKTPATLMVTTGAGTTSKLAAGSGEVQGLLDLRNTELPDVKSQLSELVSQTAAQLNAVHNAHSSVPPPQTMTGQSTGIGIDTSAGDFTGSTTVMITDASGNPVVSAAVDFDAKTITSSAGTFSFASGGFVSALNSALSPSGSATATSTGALSVSAASSANGVVIADPSTNAATAGGRGFSDYFGLNNLVSSTGVASYDTGLKASDPNGFDAVDASGNTPQVTFQLTGQDGSVLGSVSVAIPGGGTMQDLVNALNSPTTGIGLYGSYALDSNGALSFTPTNPSVNLAITSDTTTRNGGSPSLSQMFGLTDAAKGARLDDYSLRSDIASDPDKLALATYNASGSPPLSSSDMSGADALGQASSSKISFGAAGSLNAKSATISDYAASLSASIAQKASAADSASTAATAVQTEADSRRSSTEGVSLDEELVNLTTYQQAYNASARMIQAAKDMYDTLLSMVGT